jgi:hypothetical protein
MRQLLCLTMRQLCDTIVPRCSGHDASARTGADRGLVFSILWGIERTVATGLPACCANRCSAGRLRGRERCRPAEPRPSDALGGRRPGDHRVSRLGQPDWPLRDEVAVPTREPCRSRRSARPVDRQGAPAATAEDHCARHGCEREPDLRRAGRPRLQRRPAPTARGTARSRPGTGLINIIKTGS